MFELKMDNMLTNELRLWSTGISEYIALLDRTLEVSILSYLLIFKLGMLTLVNM